MSRNQNASRPDVSFGVGVLVALASVACSPRAPFATRPVYSYAIEPPPEGSWQLKVEATFDGAPSERLVAPDAADSVHDVTLVVGSGAAGIPLAHRRNLTVLHVERHHHVRELGDTELLRAPRTQLEVGASREHEPHSGPVEHVHRRA